MKKRLNNKQSQIKKMKKIGHFTLLELLIVVAILAIIGGGMIAAYDGLETNAAQSSATRDIAALDQAVRTFKVVEKGLPNNLESLLATTPAAKSSGFGVDAIYTITDADTVMASGLASKLAGKFTPTLLTTDEVDNLNDSGVTEVRYVDVEVEANAAAVTSTVLESAGSESGAIELASFKAGGVAEISIPQHMFESPREGSNRNRGRGFAVTFDVTTSVAIWNAGTGGYNNVKVGADKDAVLIGLGIGNASTLVGGSSNAALAHAPYYAGVDKADYSHYVALVDVSQSPAKLIAIVDARGDFLDEEFAESTDQKQ
jgi:prepilin-type N-terminal cleavage/methylation domain-containing protein